MTDDRAPPAPPRIPTLLVTDLPDAPAGVDGEVIRATPGVAAERLAGQAFAAVVLDARRDPAAARRFLEAEAARHAPLIVVAAAGGLTAAEAYRLGAVDHLVEPLDPDVMRAKLVVFGRLFRERQEGLARERWLRAAADHLPTLVSFVGTDHRYRFANQAYVEWFGLAPDAVVGRHLRELLGEKVYAHRLPHVAAALRGEVHRFEGPTVHRSLGVRDTEVAYAPHTTDGAVDGFFVLVHDVTERRRAADAQRMLADAGEALGSSLDYEETLAAVARLVVPAHADWCSVTVVEPGGGLRQLAVAHADPAKAEWAWDLARRYPPDPAAPRGVAAVVRTGEAELIEEITPEMLAAGARDADHLAILRGLGLRSVVTAPLAARGRTLGAVTLVAAESGRRYGPDDLRLATDLGRRAGLAVDNARLFGESQEALRLLGLLVEAAGRLTGTLDPAAVRAAVLDLSRRLVAADAHAIWRLDAATGDWAIADSAGLSAGFVRDQGHIAGAGEMPDGPIVAEDAAGAVQLESRRAAYRAEGIESVLAAPLRIHGAVSGTLVCYYRTRRRFDDVTVRVASALADLAAAALGSAELYAREAASRRRAEEADRRKDEFLATLAHELRNPLAPLRNGLAVLRMGPPADTVEKLVGMMDRQLGQLVHLVDDLLDVARVTSGKIVLRPERLDLRGVVEVAVETGRPLVDAGGHALTVRVPPDPLPVDGDRTRLAQVLTNLLNNAAKYTPPGGRIGLTAERVGADAVIRVADTGVGLPPDMLARVFEVFTQVGRPTDQAQGGLGLGLALVKSLVEMHGGAAWAESDGPDRGSTFVVRLPLAADQ